MIPLLPTQEAIKISEDEYYAGEPDEFNEDEDSLGVFLVDEPDDITLLMMPKYEFNLEDNIETYYKKLKSCRNKDEIKSVLRSFYSLVAGTTSLMNDIQYLQDRAKEIEFNIMLLNEQHR